MVEKGIKLGVLTFHYYGAILGGAMVIGGYAAAYVAKRFKIQDSRFKILADEVWTALIWAVVLGVVGARIYHVVSEWQYYLVNPGEIIAVWNGGLGIFGGIVGGMVGLWLYCFWKCLRVLRSGNRNLLGRRRWCLVVVTLLSVVPGRWPFGELRTKPGRSDQRKFVTLPAPDCKKLFICIKEKLMSLLDVGAFGLPLAQAVGRLGNFVNQELYGKPLLTQVKPPVYALYIAPENRLVGYEQWAYYHPLFVYEAILNLMVWGLLIYLAKKRVFRPGGGKYFAVYLFGYSLVRFWLEPLRIEVWTIGGVAVAQLVGAGLMIVSLTWLLIKPEKVK